MRQQQVVRSFLAGGLRIPAEGSGIGKFFQNFLFHLFGAGAVIPNLIAATLGTGGWYPALVVAGMTDQQPFHPVQGQRAVAARAGEDIPAIAAEDVGSAAQTVEEQNSLLLGFKRVFKRIMQRAAENRAVAGL